MSNGLIDDDADGSEISCFGRSKNKATAGDDGEAEAEPSKSKHQVKQPFSKDTASCNNIGSNWKEPGKHELLALHFSHVSLFKSWLSSDILQEKTYDLPI